MLLWFVQIFPVECITSSNQKTASSKINLMNHVGVVSDMDMANSKGRSCISIRDLFFDQMIRRTEDQMNSRTDEQRNSGTGEQQKKPRRGLMLVAEMGVEPMTSGL